jgi:hypothetical protein
MDHPRQHIKRSNESFTLSPAFHFLQTFVDHKTNFPKAGRLPVYAVHPYGDTEETSDGITDLANGKQIAREVMAVARREGNALPIKGVVAITVLNQYQ